MFVKRTEFYKILKQISRKLFAKYLFFKRCDKTYLCMLYMCIFAELKMLLENENKRFKN